MQDVRVAMVALGGFGSTYVNAFLDGGAERGVKIVAAIDPDPSRCQRLDELTAAGAKVYTDFGAFLADGGAADLVTIAAPIHHHVPYTLAALAAGANVLVEKPLAGTIDEGMHAVNAAERAGRFVAVGYQWSFSDAIGALKADIVAGAFGQPELFKTYCCWPRRASYYARNDWAGRIRMPDGKPVLDSPANNATAHYLHNMLYLLGPSRQTSARPVGVTAELYRGKPIENYDTAAIRCATDAGCEVLFYTTHSGPPQLGPIFRFEFEAGLVTYDAADGTLRAERPDGRARDYGSPEAARTNKIWQCVDAARGTGPPIACDAAAALSQTMVIELAQQSSTIHDLPADDIECERSDPGDTFLYLPGLREDLQSCYDRALLPSELDLPWSHPGCPISVTAR